MQDLVPAYMMLQNILALKKQIYCGWQRGDSDDDDGIDDHDHDEDDDEKEEDDDDALDPKPWTCWWLV